MSTHVIDALAHAESLYDAYTKLSQLGALGMEEEEERSKQKIIASVSPVLCENYRNAILG